MKKGELYDSFDKLQTQANRLTEQIASLKQEMMSIIEQNAELQISNEHLRTRLREAESKRQKNEPEKGLSKSRRNLEKLYEEGFHVCNVDNMFGSRRINNEPCVFCQDVIYGDRRHDTTKIK